MCRRAFTPEFMIDPYSEIARLRVEDPVHYVDDMAFWYTWIAGEIPGERPLATLLGWGGKLLIDGFMDEFE
jgi:hypothetical protein